MNRKNRSARGGIHIGTSSILLIFLSLALISFAALSLSAANADYTLSRTLMEKNNAAYAAHHQAEAFLAQKDKALQDLYQNTSSKSAFLDQAAALGSMETAIPVSGSQVLYVALEPHYPTASDPALYTITDWHIDTGESQITYDQSLPVYH